ncbi:nose resistant to fluoxetine protein 6-like [Dermacentor silvarum]|uniref:nose resistant to fluoxetine protein 6-like n=1 Tax=Dermacentor silvarum TaxID=543639 RepID=UPI002100DB52|nr:nose resistant to fluoxetine protein 6-like [Dermacentor silvarum]
MLVDNLSHWVDVIQTLLWLAALFSSLYCVFMKIAWYQSSEPAAEATRLFHAFTDRILWSIFVAWFTFACATRRGGVLCSFLSWEGFVPLSRLSFGVYLIHYPFYLLVHHVSRERIFYSHFILISQCFSVIAWSYILSYFLFIACDAPTGNLDKLVFMRQQQSNVACTSTEVPRTRQNDASGEQSKTLSDRNSRESSVNSSVIVAPVPYGAALYSDEQDSEECWRL